MIQQVELSDVVISPSSFMLGWVQQHGWTLPPHDRVYVQQNLLPAAVLQTRKHLGIGQGEDANTNTNNAGSGALRGSGSGTQQQSQTARLVFVKEIVFFGRLEVLKGFHYFCDALDALAVDVRAGVLPLFNVTFLGNSNMGGTNDAADMVAKRAHDGRWPFEVFVLTDLIQPEAIAFLRTAPNKLAVLASLVENSPYTLLECLSLGIAVVASEVGGVPELLHPDDRERILFRPNAADLTTRLRHVLIDGVPLARPSRNPEITRFEWKQIHSLLPSVSEQSPIRPAQPQPVVTVCIVSHERGDLLLKTLNALLSQDYPNIEIVLIDNGSEKPRTMEVLLLVEAMFSGGDVDVPDMGARQQVRAQRTHFQIVRQGNVFPGAARNRAVQLARGTMVAFLDDDDIPRVNWISRMVSVAQRTNADVVTCMCDFFSGDGVPNAHTQPQLRWLTLGAAPDLGVFHNVYGAYSALFVKSSFLSLGGYTEDFGSTFEDYELFSNAVLSGLRLEMVPEPLVWYRQTQEAHLMKTTSTYQNRMRALRPYLKNTPATVRNSLLMAYGLARTAKQQS